MRYKFFVFLILLPVLVNSKNVRPRRRPFLEPNSSTNYPLLDQLALADSTWEAPSKVISATYSGNPDTGHVDHANLVINVLPQNKKPAEVDMVASQALANAKTAEEYVSKAMEMRSKYDHTTPSSSFVKYDIFENVETKHLSSTPASQIEFPIQKKELSEVSEKSSLDYDFEEFRRPDFMKFNAAFNQYKDQYKDNHFKDLDNANTNQYSDTYDPFAGYNEDKIPTLKKNIPRASNYPSKAEVFRQIEKSVLKYMRELEADGKLPGVSNRPVAHAEIKTYYRFPTSTVPTNTAGKIVNTGTHSEFFKPGKNISPKAKYSTIKPFTADTYIPETVDLTIPSKKRPKPVDLDALDVGQTWLHSNEAQPSHRKPGKPKLHFNSQTYQDINALSFPPNKGLFDEDNVPYSSTAWSDQVNSPSTLNINEGSANVGASINFGGNHQEAFGSEEAMKSIHGQYIPSVQIINGVPVSNPYKFHMDTLNDIFQNGGERHKQMLQHHQQQQQQQQQQQHHENSFGENSWNPYNPISENSNGHRDSYHPNLYNNNRNLPYDSYNPKYNNNPEDNYNWNENNRQRGSMAADMFTSGSSTRPKKVVVVTPKGIPKRQPAKQQKVKVKARPAKRPPIPSNPTLRDTDPLTRDLSPPPPEK